MIWLELRKNNNQYVDGWNFTESAFAPTAKADGAQWPFWYLIRDVQKDDVVVHLRHTRNTIQFTGYSYAIQDSYITADSPTNDAHDWDFSRTYHKVDLTNYQEFESPILLNDFFRTYDNQLREYFSSNRSIRRNKKRLFYVVQAGKLQCLNGAYFSEFDGLLSELLLGHIELGEINFKNASTGETYGLLKKRIGHRQFAENVKRNFEYQCCYPNCEVRGRGFLVSGHIARWADNPELRGDTRNGLCLCLLHDQAFEQGFFTLTEEFKIELIHDSLRSNSWLANFLQTGKGLKIKAYHEAPLIDSIREHWARIGFNQN
ncbi:HNH endonuclease [Ekhidna sp.]|uniref:HNH endonuclease n=1 Tax=Ekhidna sp. TaxID=2608089 RepID=UPI0035114E4D